MNLMDVDLNELLPIYSQGTPIASAVSRAVSSVMRSVFERCESLPCEASQSSARAMRDDELDRTANDLQIVVYDTSATRQEKARFVYEFAGTRYTAGSYANLKKGLSIFADVPESQVSIVRESTWRYYIQLESPPGVTIARPRMMERLIPKAHRAALGFDGLTMHYDNDGGADLFVSGDNASTFIQVTGRASTRSITGN